MNKFFKSQFIYFSLIWLSWNQSLNNKIIYNLRQSSQFQPNGTENIKYLEPKIWELLSGKMKEVESLWKFKKATVQNIKKSLMENFIFYVVSCKTVETHFLPLQTMPAIFL